MEAPRPHLRGGAGKKNNLIIIIINTRITLILTNAKEEQPLIKYPPMLIDSVSTAVATGIGKNADKTGDALRVKPQSHM